MRSSLLMVLSLLCPPALAAQYQLAVLAGSAASHGNARSDIGPDHPELRPDNATAVAVAVRRWSGTLARRRRAPPHHRRPFRNRSRHGGRHPRGARGMGWRRRSIGRRLAGAADAEPASRRCSGAGRGPLAIRGDRRRQPMARRRAAPPLEADLPAGGRWLALIRGEVAVGPSLFDAGELPADFRATPAWRYGISLGVARAW